MNLLLDDTVKVSLVLLVALSVCLLWRRRSAAVRHWVLAVAIGCAAATPLLGLMMPVWPLGLETLLGSSRVQSPAAVVSAVTVETPANRPTLRAADHAGVSVAPVRFTIAGLLLSIWIAGAGVSLAILLVGLARLRWIASGARRIDRGRWVTLAEGVARTFGLRRSIALLHCDRATLLVTWGLMRPKVMLPAAAVDWSDDRALVVLRHELAHIRRGDWAVQMMAEVLRVVFWFNPLVWIACARLRQESEHACDDAVLDGGVNGADYAGHLLDLARLLTAGRTALPASAMARPSHLEGRITAMLNTGLNRRPLSRRFRVAIAIALASLTISIAGLAAQGAFFTLSGTVLDPSARVLPKTTVTLTNTKKQSKYEVHSNETGRFEFVGVPSGDYTLEASQAGFAPFKDALTVAGRNVDRTIDLQVGSLQETISVSGKGGQRISATSEQLQAMRQPRQARQKALDACASGTVGPVGGKILPPFKIVDVRPVYPEQLKDAKVGGVVAMDAVIGTDGTIKEVHAVTSPHPDLETAAIEAVRQWQFSPTLLNCTPIEVRMHVTTSFAVQP